jgi:hypothetical protein
MTQEEQDRLVKEFTRVMGMEGHVVLGNTVHGRTHIYSTTPRGVQWIENGLIHP